jgi:hypothetical protein
VAPGNCPTEADFEAGVRARTAFARFADEPNAQAVHVIVRPTGAKYAGHLSIVSRSGRASERDVQDALCSNVVDALALVTALAVDPNATLLLPAAASPPPAGPAEPPLDAPPPDSPAIAPPPPPPPAATIPPPAARPTSPPLAKPRSPSSAPRWGAGAGATFVTIAGIAPDPLVGGGAYGEIESRSPGSVAPSVRITVFATENGVLDTRTLVFDLLAARADLCPWRIGSRTVSIRPCVAVDVGALYADGTKVNVTDPKSHTIAWFDAAALLRGRWAPGHGPFFIELEGGILVPVTRPSFYYGGADGIHQVDPLWAVAVAGSLAAGLRFW